MNEEGNLPSNWSTCTLDELAETVRGVAFPSSAKQLSPQPGHVCCLRTANVQAEVDWSDLWYIPANTVGRSEQYVRPNDILISTANSYELVGKVALVRDVPQTTTLGAFIALIRANPACHPKFLYYQLATRHVQQSFRERASTTTNISNLSTTKVAVSEVRLAPLAEQGRIVEVIDELLSDLDAGVAVLKRARANLKKYRTAVLKAGVTGDLTADWRAAHQNIEPATKLLDGILAERRRRWESDYQAKFAASGKSPPKDWQQKYLEPISPDTNGLTRLPVGWCWASVGQLVQRIEAGKSFECLTRRASPDEWGIIKVSAMTWGEFLEEENKAVPPHRPITEAAEIHEGDLLLSRSNTSELVGATVLVGRCRPRLLLSDKSMRLVPVTGVNRTWLHRAMSSTVARRQMSAVATLRRLIVDFIDKEAWMTLDADVKGDIYEGLIERSMSDAGQGAGQYPFAFGDPQEAVQFLHAAVGRVRPPEFRQLDPIAPVLRSPRVHDVFGHRDPQTEVVHRPALLEHLAPNGDELLRRNVVLGPLSLGSLGHSPARLTPGSCGMDSLSSACLLLHRRYARRGRRGRGRPDRPATGRPAGDAPVRRGCRV